MINRETTIRWKGYDPDKLKPNSHKKVWAICNNCGNGRWIIFQAYRDICHLCNQKINNPFKGKKHTKETLIKMSEIKRGKTSPRKGVKLSKETKKKISISLKGKWLGKENPRWNPNLTNDDRLIGRKYLEYFQWRIAVFEKDNYTCQICGDNTGGNLNAHHIESYINNPDLRITISNGITLCENCHNFHHQYGYGNNTKKQFIEFIGGCNHGSY